MLVGQSGTTVRLASIGCVMPQSKQDGTSLGKDMFPCRYVTPSASAAVSRFGLDAPRPWSVGGLTLSLGSGLYTPRPEYDEVLRTDPGTLRPRVPPMVWLLAIWL